MKRRVHRFIDWMEKAPAWMTIWFIPIVIVLWIAALIINTFKKEPV